MFIQEENLAFLKYVATLPAGKIKAAGGLYERLGDEVLIDRYRLIFAANFIAGKPSDQFDQGPVSPCKSVR
ncbi:hypothetical protein GCM10007148_01690 [Parvularcula lutaonensis]|nr:hypothetical protein GCM10007148_01690 [Parvularcula lutaonensis]